MTLSTHDLNEFTARIRAAVAEELNASSSGIPFRVIEIGKQGGILTLELEPQDLRRSLDESMEDGRLGWNEKANGSADIISVLPEVSCVHALMRSGHSPAKGELVFVNPARFLEPLLRLWDQQHVAHTAANWYFRLNSNSHEQALVPDHIRTMNLCRAQQAAFRLTGWDASYLWGPPGTGKTT